MPKRFAFGTSLGLFSRRTKKGSTPARRAGVARAEHLHRAVIDTLESRTLMSATYFVSTTGNDGSAGTLASPFRTIQKAASVANSGDVVDIRGGTYRETVHPAHSGVTFTNYNNETVIVSGADLVTGFSNYSGSVYKASMGWDLGTGGNQVFVDGKMVNEARWPNNTGDVSHPNRSTIGSYSNGYLYDSSITQGNGYWNGATITITPGDAWVAYSGQVTNSGPGWLQVSLPGMGGSEQPTGGNHYFLSGKFNALDASNEFYRDSSGNLYLRDSASDNPANHTVEAKHRQYAFDLSGVSGTTIKGINIFAATIHTDGNSYNTTLNGITAQYLSQFVNLWGNGWSPPSASGIELNGSNSILENSTIAYSAGDGVYVGASNCRVTNNTIHDVDYSATDAAGVRIYGSGSSIDHNTIYNAGRDGVLIGTGGVKVLNNTIHDIMLQTQDGAGIYSVNRNGGGTEIAYNNIYNAHTGNTNGLDANGIMLDNNCSNFIVHDNSTWNVDAGFKANFSSYNEQIYNNKLGGTQYAIESNGWTGFAYDWGGTQLYNNVYYNGNLKIGANLSQWGNSYASGSVPTQSSGSNGTPTPPGSTAGPVSTPTVTPSTTPTTTPVTTPTTTPVTTPTTTPVTTPATGPTWPAKATWMATNYWKQSGLAIKYNSLGSADNGDWVEYGNVNFGTGVSKFSAGVAVTAAYAGQQIQVHLDSPTGKLVATLKPTATGSWSTFTTQSTSVSGATGVHNLFITFVGTTGIANLNWFTFS